MRTAPDRAVSARNRAKPRPLALMLAAVALIPAAFAQGPGAAESANAPIRMGFSAQIFVDVNESDARASLKIWTETMGSEHGIPVDSSLPLFPSAESIRDAFVAGTVDAVAMTTIEYWSMHNRDLFGPRIVVGMAHGSFTQTFLLIVNNEDQAAALGDLRGKTLNVLGSADASLSEVWMETLLLEHGLGNANAFWGQINGVTKLSRAVLPVFFKTVDACVVSSEGFRTMCELNPQIGRRLHVLATSEPFVTGPCCFRRGIRNGERLLAHIDSIVGTPSGMQTLVLFHMEQLVTRPISDLDSVCAMLDRHEQLLGADLARRALPGTQPKPAAEARKP